jgi:hypothetical protein
MQKRKRESNAESLRRRIKAKQEAESLQDAAHRSLAAASSPKECTARNSVSTMPGEMEDTRRLVSRARACS